MGYCKFLDPAAGTVPSTGNIVISGNVIRDSNSDGIMIIDDLGVQATATVTDNVIKDLSQALPGPLDRRYHRPRRAIARIHATSRSRTRYRT